MCAFHGVELADNGHVSSLKLKSNGLIETLPGRMIRGLVGLQVLDLSDNDLRGGVPDDRTFEMWPDLTHMILSDNPHLGGGLHPSLPNACKRLQVLQLFNANLTGPLPPALISLLPELKSMLLYDNKLTGPSPLTLLSGEAKDEAKKMAGGGVSSAAKAMAVAKGVSKFKGNLARARGKEGLAGDGSEKMATSPHHRSLTRIACHGNRLSGGIGVLSTFLKLKLRDLTMGNNQFTGPIEPLFQK